MKKILMLAAAFLLLPLAATAAQYKEGVHYTVVSEGPASAKPEITEFFSFYCPHCYNFEKKRDPKLKAVCPKVWLLSKTTSTLSAARWVLRCPVLSPLPKY